MNALDRKSRGTTGPGGVLLLLAASVALAACGDDSGGRVAALHAGGYVEAARSTPLAGSVTQSSVRSGGVTANPVGVTFTASGGVLTPTVVSPGWGFESLAADDRKDVTVGGDTWRSMEVEGGYRDGSRRIVTLITDANRNSFEDNYLVMGYWLRVPARFLDEDGSYQDSLAEDLAEFVRNIEYGAFADGGDPFEQANILALTGTATYSGGATASYVDAANGKTSDLYATASLTADFGTDAQLGTIRGTITSFQRTHSNTPESYELTDGEITGLGTLNLHAANIGDSDSGFFTADTSMVAGSDALAGKWGGQFYNNGSNATDQPGGVAGTFGATDGQKAIVGAFGADK